MTPSGSLDVGYLKIKQEINELVDNEKDQSVSYLLEPSILDNSDILNSTDPKDEFLQLTSLVRRVYFSYLHKSVINNYNVCCKSEMKNLSRSDLKKFASCLELQAVKASLEASLYRQTMLEIISGIKRNTSQGKINKKLEVFLSVGPPKKDVGIQTCLEPINSVNNLVNTSNQQNKSNFRNKLNIKEEKELLKKVKEENDDLNDLSLVLGDDEDTVQNCINQKLDNVNHNEVNLNEMTKETFEEESRDSLIQHLEDMFCESDDSSDLMNLIEKHSGIKKSSIDSEISKMCLETESPVKKEKKQMRKTQVVSEDSSNRGKRKLTFDNYKKMKKRSQEDANVSQVEQVEDRQTRKVRGVWFIERVHQVAKLRSLMMEISARNYRKHGRLRAKFIQLFGDTDDEEMMPESPIPIEEHLNSCKDRIAPWVVKHLMPYYHKKIIRERVLFKAVAKHVVDMLIIENTFPEEECVSKFIKNYFRNKTCISTQADIYV